MLRSSFALKRFDPTAALRSLSAPGSIGPGVICSRDPTSVALFCLRKHSTPLQIGSTTTRSSFSSTSKVYYAPPPPPASGGRATGGSATGAGLGSSSSSSSASSGPSPAQQRYNRQKNREWFVVAAAGSAALFGGWWYWYRVRPGALSRHEELRPDPVPHHPSEGQSRGIASSSSSSFKATAPTVFSIPVKTQTRGINGEYQVMHKVITSLTEAEVLRRLTENERTTTVERPAGACLVARYDTNQVASNEPVEDKRAEVIVERDRAIGGGGGGVGNAGNAGGGRQTGTAAAISSKGDLCFFAVMDGHAGYATSTLLSQKLIAFVALELDKVFREAGDYAELAKAKATMPSKLWTAIFGGSSGGGAAGLDGDPEIVRRALGKAFRALDREIVNTPVELLKEYELSLASNSSYSSSSAAKAGGSAGVPVGGGGTRSLSALAHTIFPTGSAFGGSPGFTATQRTAHEALLPALSGSCALLTYIDSARGDVYVACTGDSRAVAGWWDPKEERWEVEALSVDQTGRNESEAKRMRAEHPSSEAANVIMRGRVLGGLEPTRAFGDARYKWDRELQIRLYDTFLPGGRDAIRPPPRFLETPPYVTATPEVEWRHVDKPVLPAEGSASTAAGTGGPSAPSAVAPSAPTSSTGSALTATAAAVAATAGIPLRRTKELRFIIMATDGLWDMMSNEEACALVAGHLEGTKGDANAKNLMDRCYTSQKKLSATLSPAPTSAQAGSSTAAGAVEQKQQSHPLSKSPEHMRAFTFQDANLSTHLIRNALGGANRDRVAGLLAIPAPESRRYRDDITVNVIVFHGTQAAAAASSRQGSSESSSPGPSGTHVDETAPKAKL